MIDKVLHVTRVEHVLVTLKSKFGKIPFMDCFIRSMDSIFGDIAFYFIQNVIAVLRKIKVVEVACVESAGKMKKC